MAANVQVSQAPMAVTVVTNNMQPQITESARNRHKDTLYKLGITEMVLGSCAVVLCIISITIAASEFSYHSYYYFVGLTYVSPGIWCGIFPIISGGLGVCTRKNPSVGMYNANMTMSIITSFMMCVLFIMSIMSTDASQSPGLKAVHALLLVIGLTVMIVGVVHSAYCCAGVCCTRKPSGGQVLYTSAQTTPGAQYVQLANGQYMLVQNPTIVTPNYPVAPMQAPGMPQPNMAPQPVIVHPPVNMQMAQPPPNVQMAQAPPQPAQIDVQAPSAPAPQQPYVSGPPPYDAANYAVNPNYK